MSQISFSDIKAGLRDAETVAACHANDLVKDEHDQYHRLLVVQLTLSRVIVEMVVDGGGHFSPAGYRWFTRMSLLLSSSTAHSRAVGTLHTITNTNKHTERGYSTSLDRGV